MNLVPNELKELKQWHCWIDSGGTKIPVQVDGNAAKSNDPDTWTDFTTALEASTFYSGLAFEIAEPYTGIDLDNCLDVAGQLRAWAIPIVARLDGIAFAEISPSGSGIKFITRARKTTGARCVHVIDGDKQQLEVYDGKRFWTVTGQSYNWQSEIGDGQDAVDWICREYLTQPAQAPRQLAPACVPSYLTTGDGLSLEGRAQAYTDGAEPAGAGDRNNAAFRLAGHLWAMTGDMGERLNVDQVDACLQIWNSRNGEPLPEGELQKVMMSARVNGTARDEKCSELPQMPEIPLDDGVNLDGIMREFREFKALPPTYDHLCLEIPGLIGDLIQHNLRTAYYPLPELALAGALSLMSVVAAGKIHYQGSASNLYCMGLAPSGAGKDHSRKLNRKILLRAGHPESCGPERIGSHAGIVTAMAGNWRTLFQIDEIGALFASMKNAKQSPHLTNISSVLMQIYTSTDSIWYGDAYGDANKVKQLTYPHCIVYGTSVPDGFWESISSDQMQNGLIGRFLVFENPEYVDYQDPKFSDIPEDIVSRAAAWMDKETGTPGNLAALDGGSPEAMEADPDAADRLRTHAVAISDRRKSESPMNAAIWSRVAEKTNKIALLFAASRWVPGEPLPSISIDDANRAIKLNNWLTRRMLLKAAEHLSDNIAEQNHLRLLRLIRRERQWSLNALTRATRWLKGRERHEILTAMVLGDEIVMETKSTGGRPVTIVRISEGT